MQAEARLASSMEAAKLASMAEVAYCPPGDENSPMERDVAAMEYGAVEIAAALTLTRRSAERQLDLALSLHGPLRQVLGQLGAGRIDFVKAVSSPPNSGISMTLWSVRSCSELSTTRRC